MDFNFVVEYGEGYFNALKEIDRLLERFGDRNASKELLMPKFIAVKTQLNPEKLVESLHEKYVNDPQSISVTKRWIPVHIVCGAKSILEALKELDLIAKDRYAVVIEAHGASVEGLKEKIVESLRAKYDEVMPEKFLYVLLFGSIAAVSLLRKRGIFER